MGFLDRFKKQPAVDEDSIRAMLTERGATDEQAHELVAILGTRLSPARINDWLADPQKSHGIPDPDSEAKFGTTMHWTAVNAIASGKTDLVIQEARRYANA